MHEAADGQGQATPPDACAADQMIEPVQHLSGAGYVWQAEGAIRLRQDHRIIGSMVGGLPGQKQQNDERGLPMELNAPELHHVRRAGAVTLRTCPVGAGAAQRERAGNPSADEHSTSDDESLDETWQPPQRRHKAAASHPAMGHRMSVPDHPPHWSDDGQADCPAAQVHQATRAQGVRDAAESAVLQRAFDDLRARGFSLTDGIKFGGHFLAYQGDPLVVHAAFVVRVLRRGCILSDVSLSAASRAAVGAKKRLLLAFVDPEAEGAPVEYVTAILTDGAE